MRRWAWHIFVGLSAMLFVAVSAFWVRSYWRGDWVSMIWDFRNVRSASTGEDWIHRVLSVVSYRGTLTVLSAEGVWERPATTDSSVQWKDYESHSVARRRWFAAKRYSPSPWHPNAWPMGEVTMPHALPWAAAAGLLAVGLWGECRLRRLKLRARLGLCLTCGYDLRASQERCPECGCSIPADFPRPNSGTVEQAKDGRDVPSQT